ncbi:hypothetical protein ACOSP7_014305 [Xanthoceras sorbifolium]
MKANIYGNLDVVVAIFMVVGMGMDTITADMVVINSQIIIMPKTFPISEISTRSNKTRVKIYKINLSKMIKEFILDVGRKNIGLVLLVHLTLGGVYGSIIGKKKKKAKQIVENCDPIDATYIDASYFFKDPGEKNT